MFLCDPFTRCLCTHPLPSTNLFVNGRVEEAPFFVYSNIYMSSSRKAQIVDRVFAQQYAVYLKSLQQQEHCSSGSSCVRCEAAPIGTGTSYSLSLQAVIFAHWYGTMSSESYVLL